MAKVFDVKIVIRCRDLEASLTFYREIIGLEVTQDWDEPDGRGAILAPGGDASSGSIEIYEMNPGVDRYHPAFSQPLTSDKIDVQLRTDDLEAWLEALNGRWPTTDTEVTDWGHIWIKLRDPDNLLVAIYEEVRAG